MQLQYESLLLLDPEDGADCTENETNEAALARSAALLYGLIHARFIVTPV